MLKSSPPLPVRLAAVLLVLPLGYALYLAARTTLADAYASPAKYYLQTKRNADEALTPEEWRAIHDSLVRSLELSPGNPANLSELGRLYRILLEPDNLDAEQILRDGNAATGYYQAALALRPTWPWDWGDLAQVKYEQYQEHGSVYQDALVRTVEFGPRESELQNLVAELGSDTWAALGPQAAQAVLTAADRALERDAKWFPGMAAVKERWRRLCARAGESFRYLRQRCEALELT